MQSANSSRLSRRDFLRASAGLTGVVFLAACAPGAVPGAAPAAGEQAAPAGGRVEITFMGWGGPEEDEGVKAAIEQFESEQDKVKVTWLHTPENYPEKLLTDIAAGTPPDTAFIGSDMYRTLIANTLLLDITDNLKADPLVGAKGYFIEPQEEQRCTQDGKWYGIGSCWVAPHIYYNADVFAEAGVEPPSNDPAKAWTWQQFLDAATALTIDATGKHPNESGFDAENIQRWGVQWANNWYFLDSAIVGNGGYYVDPNTGLFVLDQPAATEAVQNLADLVLKHKVSPAGTAMEALGMTNTQMLDTGRLAMAIDGSWALSWLYKITAKLGTGVLPGMSEKTGTDMQAHFHSGFTSTQHPAESWEWLRFLATPFYQTQFCKIGLWLPSQTDLMTQEGLTTWLTPGVHPDGYVDIATKFVPQYGKTMFMPPGWQEANTQVIVPAIEKIWIGDATAEEALIAVMPEANKILQEAAKS